MGISSDKILDTRTALLIACRDNPEADDPRLALADYLDDLPDVRPSRECSMCVNGKQNDCEPGDLHCNEWDCEHCQGTGRIYGGIDPTNAEWAELIRVQVELARCRACPATFWHPWDERDYRIDPPPSEKKKPCGWCPVCKLAARERELTAALGSRLSAPCPGCGGEGLTYQPWRDARGRELPGPGRGQSFLCPTCDGVGDLFKGDYRELGSPTPLIRTVDHHFDRGLLYLDVTLGEVVEQRCSGCGCTVGEAGERGNGCARCDGGIVRDWRPTPWAAALLPEVVGLWVTDREPYHNAAGCFLWVKHAAQLNHLLTGSDIRKRDAAAVPPPVFDLLAGDVDIQNRAYWRTYRTFDLARLHLAHALRRFAAGVRL